VIHVQFLPAYRNGVVHPLIRLLGERLVDRLADRGIGWNCDASAAELVWACQHQYEQRPDLPTIVHEVIDWATLNWIGRQSVQQAHVPFVLKGCLFRELANYNSPLFEHTFHGMVIRNCVPGSERPETPAPELLPDMLSEEQLGRLRLGYNWLYHPRLDFLAELDREDSDREIDVCFVGTTEYSSWHVQWHRERVMGVLESLPGRVIVARGRPFKARDYDDLVSRSRVVVSPWGFGETCIRDVEAILAGAVLVKPHTPFVRTWPEYHDAEHCLTFQPDASDLARVVAQALERFDQLAGSRRSLQAEFKALRSLDVLADRVAGFVREAIES